ncbi:hypothetical protein D3C86_1313420 [compost metagenome]
MLFDVIIKALSRAFFNNSTDHVVIEIAILVTFSRFIGIVTFGPIGIFIRINGIKVKIPLTIVNTGSMRHHHF